MDKFLESVLKNDIEGICRIYVEAEDEQKNVISDIIDTVYLLLQSSQNDLGRVYKALRKEFDRNIKEKGQKAAKLLGVDPEFIGAKSTSMDAYDQHLLDDLDALAEKLDGQTKTDPAVIALLGVLNPALNSYAPIIRESAVKDHSLVLMVRERLKELLTEGKDDGV